MSADLSRKDIDILMRWCQYGEDLGHMLSPKLAALDHPMAQWALEMGQRFAKQGL